MTSGPLTLLTLGVEFQTKEIISEVSQEFSLLRFKDFLENNKSKRKTSFSKD